MSARQENGSQLRVRRYSLLVIPTGTERRLPGETATFEKLTKADNGDWYDAQYSFLLEKPSDEIVATRQISRFDKGDEIGRMGRNRKRGIVWGGGLTFFAIKREPQKTPKLEKAR